MDDILFLNKNGYLIKKNILTENYCRKCIDYLKNNFNGKVINMPQTNIPYFYCNFDKNSIIYNILNNTEINDIMKKVLGDNFKLLWFKIFNKIKWIGQDVEYHQEIIYNKNSNINVNDSFQLFIALNNHTLENGCLKIIPKVENKILLHDEFIDRHGDHKFRVNCNILSELFKKNGIINCKLETGDCVFFKDTIPHASSSNASPNDRYGVSISFIKKNIEVDTVLREKSYRQRKKKSEIYLNKLLNKISDKSKKTPKIFI